MPLQEANVAEPTTSGLLGYVLYIPEYYRRIVADLLWQAMANPSLLKSGSGFLNCAAHHTDGP